MNALIKVVFILLHCLPLHLPTPPPGSQESYWSHYTSGSLSTQSSQEDCPDLGGEGGEGGEDYTAYHRVIQLATCVNPTQVKMHR